MDSLTTYSMLDTLTGLADDVRARAHEVLDVSKIVYNDINSRGSGVVFVDWNPRRWAPLAPEEQHRLPALIEARDTFHNYAHRAIEIGDARQHGRFDKAGKPIASLCEMEEQKSRGAGNRSLEAWHAAMDEAVATQMVLLRALPTARKPPRRLLIADTNTFLLHGDIEQWALGDQTWTLVAVPQVVSELDDKKLDPRLKDKAQAAIRRFKEYGRRGDTLRGQVKIAGKLSFTEIALEPNMDEALPWLRADSPDDRLLSSVVEIMWRELASSVALITGDRNLQNKARYARVTYLDHDALG
jgi:hypothetical protein